MAQPVDSKCGGQASILIEAPGRTSVMTRIVQESPGTQLFVLRSGLSERLRDYPKGEELCSGQRGFD